MLEEMARATGIRFELEASLMTMRADEPGRAGSEQRFVAVLSWIELIEVVAAKNRHTNTWHCFLARRP